MSRIRLATFRLDVTPPIGSPLCAGLVEPAREVTDRQYAIGAVLLGDDAPIVLCVVDWCEIGNQAHFQWRDELARALDTTPSRVVLHTVHQHNAPLADLEAQRIVAGLAGVPPLMDVAHFRSCVAACAGKARKARGQARPVSAAAFGGAEVTEVASARRILGDDGKVRLTRWSTTTDPETRAAPEGTIDRHLRTVSFLDEDQPMLSMHFYATHPMSYYGDGKVTSDFAGLARERRRAETPGCEHMYFNGCGGDVTAGKHNDGTPESRARLTGRIHDAMVESESGAHRWPLERAEWASIEMRLPSRRDLEAGALEALARDTEKQATERTGAALRLSWLRRVEVPTSLARLRLGEANLVFLPGEPFVEYQLFAASLDGLVAVAGYGDCGTGYIPLSRSYAEGGYEPTASSVSEGAEPIVKSAIGQLLAP